jgi:hypothetical protein
MNDWIKWNGGECPVGFWDRVEIRLRCGVENEGDANCFVWEHLYGDSDIVKYRIIEQTEDRENIL